jgi:Tol biopolymer transport system component
VVGPSVRKGGNGRIAFVAEKHDSEDETEQGFERIYTVAPDGSSPQVVLQARRRGFDADHYDALSWTPDGSRITVLSQSIHGSPHFTLDQAGGRRRVLRLDPIGTSAAAWAPDGRLLGYSVGDALRVLDARTGVDRVVWAGSPRAARVGSFGRLTWTPRGQVVAVTGPSGTGRPRVLRLIDVKTGETRILLHRPDMSEALLSPDGTAAAVLGDARTDCSRTLAVVDLRTGRSHPVTSTCVAPGGFDWSPDGERLAFASFAGEASDEAVLWSVSATGGAPTALLMADSIGADRLANVSWQPTDPP